MHAYMCHIVSALSSAGCQSTASASTIAMPVGSSLFYHFLLKFRAVSLGFGAKSTSPCQCSDASTSPS
jgi:hypothetical protein